MFLWDANILRYYAEGHPMLRVNLSRRTLAEIALPSVVVAEVLRGRCEYALKAPPSEAPLAHQLLLETQQMLWGFNILVFDKPSAEAMFSLQKRAKAHKRYADMMIAAMALAGNHVVVTRNMRHFTDLLPPSQINNWIDELVD